MFTLDVLLNMDVASFNGTEFKALLHTAIIDVVPDPRLIELEWMAASTRVISKISLLNASDTQALRHLLTIFCSELLTGHPLFQGLVLACNPPTEELVIGQNPSSLTDNGALSGGMIALIAVLPLVVLILVCLGWRCLQGRGSESERAPIITQFATPGLSTPREAWQASSKPSNESWRPSSSQVGIGIGTSKRGSLLQGPSSSHVGIGVETSKRCSLPRCAPSAANLNSPSSRPSSASARAGLTQQSRAGTVAGDLGASARASLTQQSRAGTVAGGLGASARASLTQQSRAGKAGGSKSKLPVVHSGKSALEQDDSVTKQFSLGPPEQSAKRSSMPAKRPSMPTQPAGSDPKPAKRNSVDVVSDSLRNANPRNVPTWSLHALKEGSMESLQGSQHSSARGDDDDPASAGSREDLFATGLSQASVSPEVNAAMASTASALSGVGPPGLRVSKQRASLPTPSAPSPRAPPGATQALSTSSGLSTGTPRASAPVGCSSGPSTGLPKSSAKRSSIPKQSAGDPFAQALGGTARDASKRRAGPGQKGQMHTGSV